MASAAPQLRADAARNVRRIADAACVVFARQGSATSMEDVAVEDDIPRLALMLFATLRTFEPGSDGWRRYLDLMLDALAGDTTPLTPPSPLQEHVPNLPIAQTETR